MTLVRANATAVCVDQYEAAIDGWRNADPLDGEDAGRFPAKPARDIKPHTNISATQAEASCRAAAKRLCTEEEWTAACRGPAGLPYPYGNEYQPGACNEGRPSPLERITPEAGRLDDARLAEGVAPGGAFPKCVTATGIYDMHGNVHEWVSTPARPDDPRYGMFLGGFFAEAKENGEGCGYKTTAHFRDYHDYSTGFRCCKDASQSAPTTGPAR